MGKYGAFPTNLIIHRPYHLTYELQDKLPGESFSRLRVVPASELHEAAIADEASPNATSAETGTPEEAGQIASVLDGVEYSLAAVDGAGLGAKSNRDTVDDSARQTLTTEEIEELKRDGTGAGRDLIAKLMLSHTALDEKTAFSLAKYKLLKTKKYIRRFSVAPVDPSLLGNWLLEDKDAGSRTLELREEILGLLGCWANIHYAGPDRFLEDPVTNGVDPPQYRLPEDLKTQGGRYLVVDDTGGLLVAAMAERMDILYPDEEGTAGEATPTSRDGAAPSKVAEDGAQGSNQGDAEPGKTEASTKRSSVQGQNRPADFHVPFSLKNTLTVIHSNSQSNLAYLRYYGFDCADPNHPPHPLNNNLMSLTWLHLLHPEEDAAYSTPPPQVSDEVLNSWKANRRGHYHRKRRRWARTQHIVHSTRAGGFAGLVVASTMDPISILRHTLPLLASGAPIAIYSQSIEPLAALADCFSIARRSAWSSPTPPEGLAGKTKDELDRWEGSEDFPLNPTLLLGATVQTSRARKWQVLPGRTHPHMTGRGGAEGYVFTAWRAQPAEGRVAARGKFKRR